MLKKDPLANAIRLSLGAMLLAGASQVTFAQEQAADIEEVVVTGSRIARDEFTGPAPVVTVSQADMTRSGFSSVQDVLAAMPQNSGGASVNQQQSFSYTPAANAINLRGVGVERTMVMVDGRRLPKYPVGHNADVAFQDVSQVPFSALERMDVVTTGSSAVYGSDGMGGVVNFVLRDSYDGVKVDMRYSDTEHGGGGDAKVSILTGAEGDRSRGLFFVEYQNSQQVMASQRDNFGIDSDVLDGRGTYSSYGISLRGPDTYVPALTLDPADCEARAPGFTHWDFFGLSPDGVCGFNRTTYRQLQPDNQRFSMLAKASYDIDDNNRIYTRIDATNSSTSSQIEPVPNDSYSYFVGQDANYNADPGFVTLRSDLSGDTARFDQATGLGGDFASLADGEYYLTRRMVDFGPRRTEYDILNANFVFGIEGDITDTLSYDVGYQYGHANVDSVNYGYMSALNYFNYLAGGTNGRSAFPLMTADQIDDVKYSPWNKNEAILEGYTFALTGDVMEMSAGTVKFAAGLEYFEESYFQEQDVESAANRVLGTGGTTGTEAGGARDFWAVYGEMLIPATEQIDVTVAARYDEYSDFGDNISPQLSLEYRPLDGLLVRGSWAQTFRAPDMFKVYGNPSKSFQQVYDRGGCDAAGGTYRDQNDPIPACNGELYVDVISGANQNLDSESGETWSVGAVYEFEAAGDWRVSADIWNIYIDDIIASLAAQDITERPDLYESLIQRDPNTGSADAVTAVPQNLSWEDTTGVDIAADWMLDTNYGMFDAKINVTYLAEKETRFDETSRVENLIAETMFPEWRTNLRVGYERDIYSTALFVNYIGEMAGEFNGENGTDKIDSWTTINWTGAVEPIDGLVMRVGINNLTDEGPNFDDTNTGWPSYPREFYNAMGRSYFGQVEWKF